MNILGIIVSQCDHNVCRRTEGFHRNETSGDIYIIMSKDGEGRSIPSEEEGWGPKVQLITPSCYPCAQ